MTHTVLLLAKLPAAEAEVLNQSVTAPTMIECKDLLNTDRNVYTKGSKAGKYCGADGQHLLLRCSARLALVKHVSCCQINNKVHRICQVHYSEPLYAAHA